MNGLVSAAPSHATEHSLAELIEELSARMEAGEAVELQACLDAYPEHAGELRRLYPALHLLADFSRSGETNLPTDGLEPAPAPAPGTPLGDFRLLREIGRGGMGVVYEAEQLSLSRRVALKVLPFASTLDARQLLRFKNEAQAAACLHHSNIVPVFATGCERGVHFFAMQYIEGVTLAALIAELRQRVGRDPAPEGRMPTPLSVAAGSADTPISPNRPEAAQTQAGETTLGPAKPGSSERLPRPAEFFHAVARLGIQAAEALEHAHQLGVVHRDIKPSNLLIEQTPLPLGERARGEGLHLWVTDFGLAQVQSDTRLTLTGDLVGTLRYMSPEQALAQHGAIDHRTDVYSLGVTLYELVTLRPAFRGEDRRELLRQLSFEEPPPPRRLSKAVPAELETIVLKAMAKEPAERYATARDLADDLRCFLEDRPIRARRPTWTQRARKWVRRHRAAVATGVIASIVLLAGAVAALTISNVRITQETNQKDEALRQSRASEEAATRRLKQTLQAVDRMLGRAIHGPLVDVPQVEPVRRGLYEDALEFNQQLLQECGSAPELRLEMAETNYRIGLHQLTLGQPTEAEEAFRRGIAVANDLLAEAPGEPAYRRVLALCRRGYTICLEAGGGRMQEREREARASLELWLGLAKEFPAKLDYQYYVGLCQNHLAHWLWGAGRPAEAEQAFRQALATHQKVAAGSSGTHFVFGVVVIDDWHNLGTHLKKLDRAPEAEGAYRNALQEAQKFKQVFPRTVTARRRLATVQQDLGRFLCTLGRQGEGRELLAQAIAGRREMLEDYRNCPSYAEESAVLEIEIGRLLMEDGHPGEAEQAFRQALDYYEEAARMVPDARHMRRCRGKIAYCWESLGLLRRSQGRYQQAEEALRRALPIYQQRFDESPQQTELRRDLANSHNNLAWLLAIRPDRQPHHAAAALEHGQKAVDLQPEHHDWWHTLGVAHCRLGHWKEALACIEKSRKLENKKAPPDSYDRFFEAMAYWHLGEQDMARRCYDEGMQWMEQHAPDHPDLRRFRAEAAELLKM
jgi:serine/threonine protein kinase/Tfp pilus assembly protein PilF